MVAAGGRSGGGAGGWVVGGSRVAAAATARASVVVKDSKSSKGSRQDGRKPCSPSSPSESRPGWPPFLSRSSLRPPRHGSSATALLQANMTSSNQIPNLRTLLGPGRGGGLRGRGRGGGWGGGGGSSSDQKRDDAVKGTDQDAAGSRVSCVELGYLHDPYAKLFATQPSTRRLPLLNRGVLCTFTVCFYFTNIKDRLVRPHLRHRPARSQVPPYIPIRCEADRVARRRHRYTLLSSA